MALLTNVPPGVTGAVYLVLRSEDVRSVTEVRQPHVFDVGIVKCLGRCDEFSPIFQQKVLLVKPCRSNG